MMEIGDKYNWMHQSEKLVYIGRDGGWYQFAKIETPDVIWCEVLARDLPRLEQTK